jgi:hypothetical protein
MEKQPAVQQQDKTARARVTPPSFLRTTNNIAAQSFSTAPTYIHFYTYNSQLLLLDYKGHTFAQPPNINAAFCALQVYIERDLSIGAQSRVVYMYMRSGVRERRRAQHTYKDQGGRRFFALRVVRVYRACQRSVFVVVGEMQFERTSGRAAAASGDKSGGERRQKRRAAAAAAALRVGAALSTLNLHTPQHHTHHIQNQSRPKKVRREQKHP